MAFESLLSNKTALLFFLNRSTQLVPIFVNAIPVPLATDSYIIAIALSFLIHQYAPIMREVMKQSALLHTVVICLYEMMRAAVVVRLTTLAGNSIAPSEFSIAIFGPIMCGSVAGCGGAFLPLNKGLGPIETTGLAQPMQSAFIAATFYHLFNHTSLSDGIIDARLVDSALAQSLLPLKPRRTSKTSDEQPADDFIQETKSFKKNDVWIGTAIW
jgi:hypothetical protein